MTVRQILVEEVEQRLIPTLILSPHLLILQIATGGHKAVDLVAECIDLARHLQRFLKSLESLRILVTGGEEVHGHGDVGSVVGVDSRRVSFGCGRKLPAGAARVVDDLERRSIAVSNVPYLCRVQMLCTPAHFHTTPLLDLVSSLGLYVLDHTRDGRNGLRGASAPWKNTRSLSPFSGVSGGKSAAK